jgi:DNA-binding LacI/PurR family transcriptional regulator/DNA-binding transcriptional regulator YhcF (GntR family)
MLTIKKNGLCKYAQLKEHLIAKIQCDKFKAGDAFCTELELMDRFKLSYATVSRALKEMEKDGVVRRVKGHGTFVTSHGVQNVGRRSAALDTLYLATAAIDSVKIASPLSWFFHEQIQKGIINTYNGPVKITSTSEIFERIELGEKIISVLYTPDAETVAKLRAAGCLYTLINHKRDRDPAFSVNSVSWEMLLGTYDLMSYLIRDLGHTKIGFIGGDTPAYHADRFAGYQIGLKSNNIPEKDEYIIRGLVGSEKDGYKAMKRLLALREPPTAVFADTDVKAIGAIKAAHDAGLKVPADISIAGFDDLPGVEFSTPPLTTVKIPYYDMGREAVEMLFSRIGGGKDVKGVILKSSLLVRQSCSEPGQRNKGKVKNVLQ